ncbi:MAG TPA: hypothetical protein VFS16_14055, partial [Acidimicrobiia bacterium]|nr:hypothetical protein [Acidimicrobiia bacterium]
ALTVGLILGTFAVNLVPSLWYVHQHGANTAVARHAAESELYGLKLTGMILPREGHRLPGFANLTASYRDPSPVPSERGQSLGLIGAAGLAYLLIVAGLSLAGGRRLSPTGGDRSLRAGHTIPDGDRHLSLLAVALVAVGTVGGLSSLVALFLSPQIRSWNRLSIYIGFLALFGLARQAERLRAHLRARGHGPLAFAAVLVAVLAVGIADQTSGADVPRYRTVSTAYHSDGAFVAAVEAMLPTNAMVFQLPIRAFPEVRGPVDMSVSDPFRLYLHSDDLRWSFGGVAGRPTADWQTPLAAQPPAELLPRLSAVGFSGLAVDRFGYDDRAAALEAALRAELGDPAEVSPDGRFSFFDLRTDGGQQNESIRDLALNPTRIGWTGVTGLGHDPLDRLGTAQQQFTITFSNPDTVPRTLRFRLGIEGAATSPPVQATLPDGATMDIPLTDGRAVVDRTLTVPPGTTQAVFTTEGLPISDVAATKAERYHLRLTDPAIYDVLPAGAPRAAE